MGAQKVGDAFYPVPPAWLILLGGTAARAGAGCGGVKAREAHG